MSDNQQMILAIQSMIDDIDNRLLPNVQHITEEAILGVLTGTTDMLIKEMHGTSMPQHLFQAIQVQRAIIYTMYNEKGLVEIKDPVKFYTVCMETSKKSLTQMISTLKGTTTNCATCPDKEKCDIEANQKDNEEASWGSTESVH